jgi:hypothetical protein
MGGDPSQGGSMASGNKKTRTKPIRNSEGVLIRKDGRPDMRSVGDTPCLSFPIFFSAPV